MLGIRRTAAVAEQQQLAAGADSRFDEAESGQKRSLDHGVRGLENLQVLGHVRAHHGRRIEACRIADSRVRHWVYYAYPLAKRIAKRFPRCLPRVCDISCCAACLRRPAACESVEPLHVGQFGEIPVKRANRQVSGLARDLEHQAV